MRGGFLCILGTGGQLLNLVHKGTQSVNYGGKWILSVCLCIVNFVVVFMYVCDGEMAVGGS